MRVSRVFAIGLSAMTLLGSAIVSLAADDNAKVCSYLPIAELETHYGAKAAAVRGTDGAMMSRCSVALPDPKHSAGVISNAPGPALSIDQRLAIVKKMVSETKNLGTVGCFSEQLDMGEKVPSTTCFLDGGHYLSLQLISDNPKHLSFESVKQLLEKAASRRKCASIHR